MDFRFLTKSRIRNKFILFFIILACVPVLVLGGTTLYLIDLTHRQDVSALELQVLAQKEKEVQRFLAETLEVLELQVQSLEPARLQDSAQTWQDSLIQRILEDNPNFEEVSFITLEGRESAKRSRSSQESELFYVSELSSFKEAREGNRFIGEIEHTLSGPMVRMAAPVFIDKKVVQVLSAKVGLSSLTRSLEASSLGTTGYVALFDRDGTFVSHQDRGNLEPGYDLSQWFRLAALLRGETRTGFERRDRYESLFGLGPVVGAGKKISETGWVLLAEWPLKEADGVLQRVRNQILLVTLASILAVLLFAPLFASRLVKPIRELEAISRAIEQGDFEKKVNIQTNDELEELGDAFNKMAKGLQRLQELREEFVFVAAHELRTPVTIIKGYTSMILDGDAGIVKQTVKDFLRKIQTANQRLLQLVEDLLEVARSEAGRLEVKVQSIPMRELIRVTVGELQQLAKERSIFLSYEEEEVPNVLADESRVREVTMNLVGNAIKYTREKGSVRVFHETKENEVITHIEDNGFGIPQEAQAKIFQKFYRAQTKETETIQGTGLGLFIVKQLVEKMKGRIWFVSEQGKGSTFSFSLPLASNL